MLEERGKQAFEKAKKTMFQDIESEDLKPPIQYLAENLNDLLRPNLISLSCEAVGGKTRSNNICSNRDDIDVFKSEYL